MQMFSVRQVQTGEYPLPVKSFYAKKMGKAIVGAEINWCQSVQTLHLVTQVRLHSPVMKVRSYRKI